MKTFRELYEKTILKEAPYSIGLYLPEDPDYWAANIEWTKDIIKSKDLIGEIKDVTGYPHNVYYKFEFDLYEYYFIRNNTHVSAYAYFRKNTYGYTNVDIWKNIKSILKMDKLIIDYFLPIFNRIFCDKNLTNQGVRFWKKLIENNISNNKLRFGIYNNEANDIIYYKDWKFFNDEIWEEAKYQVFIERI